MLLLPPIIAHVAGTIGSNTYGVAKNVLIENFKVIASSGEGWSSDIIAALEVVMSRVLSNPSQKHVVNLSLGGPKNNADNRAISLAVDAGVVVVVAAGNDHVDACFSS